MYGEGYCLLLSIRSVKKPLAQSMTIDTCIKQFKNVLAVYNGLNKKVFELNFWWGFLYSSYDIEGEV